MKHIKVFEAFWEKPLNHNSNTKHPFSDITDDDIETHLLDQLDKGEIEMEIHKVGNIGEILPQIMTTRYREIFNLFNKDIMDKNSDSTILINMQLEHPWGGGSHGSFDYDGYVKASLKDYFRRFYNGYDINVFYFLREMNTYSDPFCRVIVMVQEDKHDVRYNKLYLNNKNSYSTKMKNSIN